MSDPSRDTIFALSSGRPPAAIAVVRISGTRAGDALKALAGRLPEPRKAALARVRDPANGEIIDEALALWFPGPNSETGEDIAELQLHGGRAVIAATLRVLGEMEGLRPAEAGEFTRRAFENGRLDLTAVEGLADLIGAETEAQRRQGYRQLKGLLGNRAETWRARLIEALALVEARIDFPDEADVPEDLLGPALAIAQGLRDEIAGALAGAGRGERLRDGLVVAIAGPPNAGKSTLLNRIARREVAIVSPIPGTTRDVIEVHLDLDGYPVTLLDTAGIRDSDDPVEQEGVRRARQRASEADLVLWVEDAEQGLKGDSDGAEQRPPQTGVVPGVEGADQRVSRSSPARRVEDADHRALQSGLIGRVGHSGQRVSPAGPIRSDEDAEQGTQDGEQRSARGRATAFAGGLTWVIRNKIDRLTTLQRNELALTDNSLERSNEYNNESRNKSSQIIIDLSAATGLGVADFLVRLTGFAASFFGSEPALISRQRHRHALEMTCQALERALAEADGRLDVAAEELRTAAQTLGRLTGKIDVEDVLDAIFRDFCIGK